MQLKVFTIRKINCRFYYIISGKQSLFIATFRTFPYWKRCTPKTLSRNTPRNFFFYYFKESVLWLFIIIIDFICSAKWFTIKFIDNVKIFSSCQPYYFMVRSPTSWIFMLDFAYFDYSVCFEHFLNYKVIGIPYKQVFEF